MQTLHNLRNVRTYTSRCPTFEIYTLRCTEHLGYAHYSVVLCSVEGGVTDSKVLLLSILDGLIILYGCYRYLAQSQN